MLVERAGNFTPQRQRPDSEVVTGSSVCWLKEGGVKQWGNPLLFSSNLAPSNLEKKSRFAIL